MTLGNMRAQGIRDVVAHCEAIECHHSAAVNVDALPEDLPVPDVALRLACSRCGARQIKTIHSLLFGPLRA
jgi:hypothetical protein